MQRQAARGGYLVAPLRDTLVRCLSAQLFQQRLGLLQVFGVNPFGEPALRFLSVLPLKVLRQKTAAGRPDSLSGPRPERSSPVPLRSLRSPSRPVRRATA